ncbi:MAG: aconitate hydratase [Nitrospirae bacterium]|nr:aconitate hydratase [Nitrospirota bacterium]
MAANLVQKIFHQHKFYGERTCGTPIGLKVDEVYTQDATGTMAWLQFEAIGVDKVKVPVAVSYVDHNMIQSNYMNPDDHAFLQSAAAKFGAYFSRPGNGICHQVNLERFSRPGGIALGTDSHTPTNGGAAMIAIGVGGLDAATVMAGSPFELTMPKVVLIKLTGKLNRPYVTAMDVILTLLQKLTVKGGVGSIFEYGGDGVRELNLTERATITNMGAELGATTSIFPSDENTMGFFKAQGRLSDWIELKADTDASYDSVIELDLSSLEPMIAMPHSPDKVVAVKELAGTKVNQVCIGGCTNSSYQSMKAVSYVLKGKNVAENVNLLINPGSKQVYEMIAVDGCLREMIASGVRMLESSCGPCIGMGGAPGSGHVSLRTFNRNFEGRSGTKDAMVYLASPVTCAIAALSGKIVDPRDIKDLSIPEIEEPSHYIVNTNMLIAPKNGDNVHIVKGPNIKGVPVKEPLKDGIAAEVLIKLGNNVTTDDIMPAGSKVLPFRSNIPAISDFVFSNIDEGFSKRAIKAKENGGGIIVGGENYGQGSSREHAALAPMFLGVEAVITVSFARIHRSNLINFGIIPLTFTNPADFEKIKQGDRLKISGLKSSLTGSQSYTVTDETSGFTFTCASNLNQRETELILAGGLLPYTKRATQ